MLVLLVYIFFNNLIKGDSNFTLKTRRLYTTIELNARRYSVSVFVVYFAENWWVMTFIDFSFPAFQ